MAPRVPYQGAKDNGSQSPFYSSLNSPDFLGVTSIRSKQGPAGNPDAAWDDRVWVEGGRFAGAMADFSSDFIMR